MLSRDIREQFLQYFEKEAHRRVKSGSLIPAKDPTLYFTNAGMVQFKDYFTGLVKPSFSRATTSQKCLRVSGKHNDLENVGRTARHHTFFEMLGNFSFGDYFKKEAIRLAWNFLTIEMKIPKEKLWITVYEKDDEAELLWQSEVGVPKGRIIRLGEKDNFWSMGETGPCGPCSEIHYDHGEKYGCKKPTCALGCDCDRFMEIWNLVFMQYERSADGSMKALPKPSIDTGMGLERLSAVVQGGHSNYESDLFVPLIHEIERLTDRQYGGEEEVSVSIRVLADHIRATAFLIADGVHPSNEGRGYVLRRIMRRAIRHGKLLGQSKPFFFELVDCLVREMGEAYPELKKEKEGITRVIRAEEEKFLETLGTGMQIIEEELAKIKNSREHVLAGDVVFKLYDTYGFPIDLTELIAQEHKLDIDMAGFERLMEEQKGRGRKAWKGSTKVSPALDVVLEGGSDFTGYDRLEDQSIVAALLNPDGGRLDKIGVGEKGIVVVKRTPFYPEGGGQVGDHGVLVSRQMRALVLGANKLPNGTILHPIQMEEGNLQEGDEIELKVDRPFRQGTMTHHSATHLLHAALREILGTHVRQAGSLVENNRLRFDFTHFEAVSRPILRQIEDRVNQKILERLRVTHQILSYDEAMRVGALAFFEEKYGDKVRVVKMGDFSIELCGGTHVSNVDEIKLLKLVQESSVAAGIRRVEAVVGDSALRKLQEMEDQISKIAGSLRVPATQVAERVEKLLEQIKTLEKELEHQRKRAATGSGGVEERVEEVKGVRLHFLKLELDDAKALRDLSDQKIQKFGSGILFLAGVGGEKMSLILRVSKDLTGRYDAGKLLKEIASSIGGSGGGRADMAQGGGPSHQWEIAKRQLTERI
ncbi:MAG: alanine--tRNA ligase [Deltaproteobacteria bacterium]|nr:alanine--tRNA ligase [Deltaproteobacteria bacterium]